MADLSITAGSVVPYASQITETGVAGETITAGQSLYKDSSTGKFMKADANAATEVARWAKYIALNGASNNQTLTVQKGGDITIGGTLTPGAAYYQTLVAGGIGLIAEVTTGGYLEIIGIATSASVLRLCFAYSGVVV